MAFCIGEIPLINHRSSLVSSFSLLFAFSMLVVWVCGQGTFRMVSGFKIKGPEAVRCFPIVR